MLEIKPIYNSGTISFSTPPSDLKNNEKKLTRKISKDPKGIIPNGIYKVFDYEEKRLIITSIISFLFFVTFVTILALMFSKVLKYHWILYVPFFGLAGFSLVKLVYSIINMFSLKKSVNYYRESLSRDSKITPPFISKLYLKLNLQQVHHNWLTIFSLFYGTIVLVIFWWLKDVSWWVFEFKEWIAGLGPSPEVISYFSIGALAFVLASYIYLTIFRKKRIIDIQSFFGNEVVSQLEIDKMTMERNKAFSRIFGLSILIILVLPIIIKIILKYTKKGKG